MVCGLRNLPEKVTLANSLESLLEEGIIHEIHGRLKSGKEAEVFAVSYGESVVAAKVYKDRAQRNFKNNAAYLEGRSVRNSRSQRAMDRGTRFGQEAAEDAWKVAEANALYKLHAAGVRVPTPVVFLDGVLLMELVRGSGGEAAPRLIDSELGREEARAAYHDMLSQLVKMLCCDLIHGDLSPYNVLWAESGATIIDFPQTISAAQNSRAQFFFERDARNILGHFAAIEPSLRPRVFGDAREIWNAYVRRELTPDFVPSGEPQRFERPPPQRREQSHQPREQRGAHQQHRSQQQRGGRDGRGAQQQRGPEQQRSPRLQMASAAANIASQRGGHEPRASYDQRRGSDQRGPRPDQRGPRPEQRGPRPEQRGPRPEQHRSQPRPQRAQQQRQTQRRAPEVIVIKRRSAEPAPPAEATERPPESMRQKRR